MKQTIFGIILGLLLVLGVTVSFGIWDKYQIMNAVDYVQSTSFDVDVDGVKYRN
jgi:uncharacterized protein YxeA